MIDIFLRTNTPIQDIPSALSGFDANRVQVRNGEATEFWQRTSKGWSKSDAGMSLYDDLCHEYVELVAYTVAFGGGFSELVGDGMNLEFTKNEASDLLAHMKRYQYQIEDAIGCSINNADGRSCALACFPLGEFKTMVDKSTTWGAKVVDWVIQIQRSGADEVGIVISHKK